MSDAFFNFSELFEGALHFMYLDIKNLVRTGVGNEWHCRLRALKLRRPARPASLSLIDTSLKAIKVAPPQVRGVQPIHRQAGSPWGYSGIWLSVRQTDGTVGVAGATDDSSPKRLWWQATNSFAAFQSSEQDQPHKMLPTLFRAKPIASLLPAWPRTPLPEDDLSLAGSQPVLAGGYQSIISGARPGVPLIFREHLQTQLFPLSTATTASHTVTSGAVPCQHRMLRPVRFPDNLPAGAAAPDHDDQLTIVPGNGVTISASVVSVNGAAVGATTGGLTGSTLFVQFNVSATPSSVQAVLAQVGYSNSNPTPGLGDRVLMFQFADSLWAYSRSVNSAVRVIQSGTAAGAGGPISYVAGSAPVLLAAGIQASDLIATVAGSTLAVQFLAYPALQTWGTYFDARQPGFDGRNLRISSDSAILAIDSPTCVTLTLMGSPQNQPAAPIQDPLSRGTIPANWDGRLAFRQEFFSSAQTDWTFHVQLSDGTTTIPFISNTIQVGAHMASSNASDESESPIFQADLAAVQAWQAGKPHGSTSALVVAVSSTSATDVHGFSQMLGFPPRVAQAQQDPLPIQPTFVLFEDPEYNRLLSSTTAHAATMITLNKVAYTVVLAADRRDYNETGTSTTSSTSNQRPRQHPRARSNSDTSIFTMSTASPVCR